MTKKSAKTILGIALVLAVAFFWQSVRSGDDKAEFTGAAKCKICHNKAEDGAQYDVWSKAKHSQAFELLGTPEAIAAGKKVGVEKPQESPKCLKCHSTVYFFSETPVTNIEKKKDGSLRMTVEEGVSCESCHWAGSIYSPKKIMEDHDASVAAGMNPNPEESCLKCHNDTSPTWKNDRYTLADGTKVGFDFDQAWEKVKHPNPKLAPAKAGKAADKK